MPATFEAQAQQTLENVKAVVEAAGLTLDHVVYTHVYLEDINNVAALDRVYARYFPKDPPARAMIGVARLPGTPVEINAVAVVNRRGAHRCACRVGTEASRFRRECSRHDRLFISSLPAGTVPLRSRGTVRRIPGSEVDAALDNFKAVTEAAG
jgi:enamine deaminase RidA (YjgF/YER057c/UK114 family)